MKTKDFMIAGALAVAFAASMAGGAAASSLFSDRLESILEKMDAKDRAASVQHAPALATRAALEVQVAKMEWLGIKLVSESLEEKDYKELIDQDYKNGKKPYACTALSNIRQHLKDANALIAAAGVSDDRLDLSDIKADPKQFEWIRQANRCTFE